MTSSDPRDAARTYMDAWRARDFDRLRTVLADDVTFRGPLGTADGADECIAGLRGMAEKVMKDVDVKLMAVDGGDVLTWFELHTASRTRSRRSTGVPSRTGSSPGSASRSTHGR